MGKISIKNYKKYIQSIHIQLIFCMLICRYPKKSRQRSHKMKIHFMAFFVCAGHGMSPVGVKPTTGSYRQV